MLCSLPLRKPRVVCRSNTLQHHSQTDTPSLDLLTITMRVGLTTYNEGGPSSTPSCTSFPHQHHLQRNGTAAPAECGATSRIHPLKTAHRCRSGQTSPRTSHKGGHNTTQAPCGHAACCSCNSQPHLTMPGAAGAAGGAANPSGAPECPRPGQGAARGGTELPQRCY